MCWERKLSRKEEKEIMERRRNFSLKILDSLTIRWVTILSQLKVGACFERPLSDSVFSILSEVPGIVAKARMNLIACSQRKHLLWVYLPNWFAQQPFTFHLSNCIPIVCASLSMKHNHRVEADHPALPRYPHQNHNTVWANANCRDVFCRLFGNKLWVVFPRTTLEEIIFLPTEYN